MGKTVFITDPVVAAHYRVHPAEFAWVADDIEAAWLVTNRHAYSLQRTTAFPAAYFVDPGAPLPFVPFVPGVSQQPGQPPDAPTPPAPRRKAPPVPYDEP